MKRKRKTSLPPALARTPATAPAPAPTPAPAPATKRCSDRPHRSRQSRLVCLPLAWMLATPHDYGVVVCPQCRWPKGLALSIKTSRCPRCNKALNVQRLKVWARVEEAKQLPEAVGRVAESLKGDLPPEFGEAILVDHGRPRARRLEPPETDNSSAGPGRPRPDGGRAQSKLDPLTMALRAAAISGASSRWERVTTAVRELGNLQDDFDESELRELLRRLGVVKVTDDDPDSDAKWAKAVEGWVGRLQEAGLIYSPTPGRYDLV